MATGGVGDILTGVCAWTGRDKVCLFMMRRDSAHGYAAVPAEIAIFNW
jgi:NAD(P)H-hydrate repair Nnr-like enzyme with NAD(P)H-hydrate dehydratase domain